MAISTIKFQLYHVWYHDKGIDECNLINVLIWSNCLIKLAKIDIIDYRFAKHIKHSINFKSLPYASAVCDRKVDIFWEMSFRFHQSTPSWQGMMHLLHKECEYPGKSSVQYLPMIDMNPGDKTGILSTLDYLCGLSSRHNMPNIITFDQP